MLEPQSAFSLAGALALMCWVALAFSVFIPPMRAWTWRITGAIVPALLAAAYIALIRQGFAQAPAGGFGSIGQVRTLFSSDAALTAGWLHYLAFDLFVGTWIARTGASDRIYPLLTVICLPLTFMLGPAGLLLFFILRSAYLRLTQGRTA